MPYRQTENVTRKLAARQSAILEAARHAAEEGGMAAVQMAAVAERAGVAAGTVYRYFPSKADLVAALVTALAREETAALTAAAGAAPGPLSALAAAITAFATRALARRRLAFALIAESIEPEIDHARAGYRRALVAAFDDLIRKALVGGRLPQQDAALAASALVGALVEGLLGPFAPGADDPGKARAQVQTLALFALRALGVVDARARPGGPGGRAGDVGAGNLEHDPEKWVPVFGKRSCSNKKLERDDDAKKVIPLAARVDTTGRGIQRAGVSSPQAASAEQKQAWIRKF